MMKLKTSAEWQEANPDYLITDPDGWDIENFKFSWYQEKITQQEYDKRMVKSRVLDYHKVKLDQQDEKAHGMSPEKDTQK